MGASTKLAAFASFLVLVLSPLVLAAPAAAETFSGEATSTTFVEPAEADILSATAAYDSTAGSVTFAVTTRGAPSSANESLELDTLMGTGALCNEHPVVGMISWYDEPEPEAEWEAETAEGSPTTSGPVTKTVSGDTTTLSTSDGSLADHPYSCALVLVAEDEFDLLDYVQIALSPAQTTSPPTTTTPPPPAPTTAPAPPSAALSIAKPKTLKLKPEKWTKVTVKVSDTGGSPTAAGALKVKAPTGVKLKPASGKLKLAALQPSGTATVSFKLKLTEKAKAKSKLSLTATAAGLTAKSTLVVKSKSAG
jgi:hypothetical protein